LAETGTIKNCDKVIEREDEDRCPVGPSNDKQVSWSPFTDRRIITTKKLQRKVGMSTV